MREGRIHKFYYSGLCFPTSFQENNTMKNKKQTKEQKKELILDLLEKYQTLSTTYLASKIKSDKYRAETFLEELLKEKKIIMIKTLNNTFWELK